MGAWTRVATGLWQVLFPELCLGCPSMTGLGSPLCAQCQRLVSWLPEVRCRRCAEPGRFVAGTCPRCVQRPPPFQRVVAPFVHEGPIANAIHRFKYEGQSELARPLGELVAAAIPEELRRSTVVCAIPLHRARFLHRQYDQAQLLAGRVARVLGLPHEPGALRRVRPTARQVGESLKARELNVRGAFAVEASVHGARVLLVDDVVTTGATAREAALALSAAGAARVDIAAVARAYTG